MNNFISAIIGDTCGSIYEWHNAKEKDEVDFFLRGCRFTDDSVLTCAVADWLVETNVATDDNQAEVLIKKLDEYGNAHPNAGYGGMFRKWLASENKEPINSFGNGSGMRCSACGYIANTYDEALILAKKSAEVTHNHPEGIKGAQAIAGCILMARKGFTKSEIKRKIEKDFGYNLNGKVDDIHGSHPFDATCQVTVPEAIIAFLESKSFDDCFKKAIWIGGDSDTIACMACAIAGAFYGVPSYYSEYVMKLLPDDLKAAIIRFSKFADFKEK